MFYSERAFADLDRLFDFIAGHDPVAAGEAARAIADGIGVLARHPYIGRAVRGPLRELVISRGKTGYVALYRVQAREDRVEVLAIRHQREAGFAP
ncbi:MAG: type II toxin-antitoxin system RelE/ParE family toxin [Burkholderiales bacterium]|nr:type II toxin-antitoxin system RelE/ParE family toxin [Burkholderiales bacterium]